MADFWSTVSRWWVEYGVPFRIVLIILLAVIGRWVLLILLRRGVSKVVSGVKKSHAVEFTAELTQSPVTAARMIQRTRTLGTVGSNFITWFIALTAVVMILDQLGVSVGALLASAGVVAAGLAFGAQNIVKDLLNGLFMVFEDQLGVGDLITVGAVTGTVEVVGIRVTQVRAVDGTLWFIRNGEILQLGNRSHGWARSIVKIDVSRTRDLERISEIIEEVAVSVVERSELARKVLAMPDVLGVDSIHSDHTTFTLMVKTRPGAEDDVSRELRLALKERFDRERIVIGPFLK